MILTLFDVRMGQGKTHEIFTWPSLESTCHSCHAQAVTKGGIDYVFAHPSDPVKPRVH